MVSSVTSGTYYSYLNQLQSASTSASSQQGPSSLISSLLSGSSSSTPSILSLIQQNSNGSFDPVSSLLGGSGPNAALTTLYSNLYASVSASNLTQAQDIGNEQARQSQTPADPVSALINQLTQASVAYNKTLQQNAAHAAGSVTPLVT